MISYLKKNENLNIKEKKKPGNHLGFASTANLAQFGWKSAGLAVLFSRQILNSSQDFFLLNILIYFFKYEIIETHGRAFLTFIILDISTVGQGLGNM